MRVVVINKAKVMKGLETLPDTPDEVSCEKER